MDWEACFERIGGIKPVVGSTLVAMTDTEIRAFEHEIGASLPGTYREFQALFGASSFRGSPPNNPFIEFQPIELLPPRVSDNGKGLLFVLYGGKIGENDSYSLELNYRLFDGRIPTTMIPIGDDGLGSQICLGITGNHIGKVFYWDIENEPLDEEDYLADYGEQRTPEVEYQNVHLVANSFDDFLNSLHVMEDPS